MRAGGWSYPFISDKGGEVRIRDRHVEASIAKHDFREFVRLYRSGQFFYASVLRESFSESALAESREIAQSDHPLGAINPTGGINIVRLMRLAAVGLINGCRLIEELGLADSEIHFTFGLSNINGQVLVAGTRRSFDQRFQAHGYLSIERQYNAAALLSEIDLTTLDVMQDIYAHFGWNRVDDHVIRGLYNESLE